MRRTGPTRMRRASSTLLGKFRRVSASPLRFSQITYIRKSTGIVQITKSRLALTPQAADRSPLPSKRSEGMTGASSFLRRRSSWISQKGRDLLASFLPLDCFEAVVSGVVAGAVIAVVLPFGVVGGSTLLFLSLSIDALYSNAAAGFSTRNFSNPAVRFESCGGGCCGCCTPVVSPVGPVGLLLLLPLPPPPLPLLLCCGCCVGPSVVASRTAPLFRSGLDGPSGGCDARNTKSQRRLLMIKLAKRSERLPAVCMSCRASHEERRERGDSVAELSGSCGGGSLIARGRAREPSARRLRVWPMLPAWKKFAPRARDGARSDETMAAEKGEPRVRGL